METAKDEMKPSQSTGIFRRRLRRAFVLYVVVPYLAVTLIFTALQRQLLYRPTVADSLTVQNVGLNSDFGIDVELTTGDGNKIRGWLVKGSDAHRSEDGKSPLVLYFPGNSLNRHERISDLREIAACGFDVLIFDYRGFGDSTGSPTEAALSEDALLVWRYACETLGYDERRNIVFGESIGGAVALSMWSKSNPSSPMPAALILNSTFASMPETVGWHYPFFPFRYLLLDRWPSIERIGNVQAPIIVFHGTEDTTVPVAHGRSLAQASSQARFIEIPDATHNDIPTLQLREELASLMAVLSSSSK